MGMPHRLYVEHSFVLPQITITTKSRIVALMMQYDLLRPEAELTILLADGLELMEAGRKMGYTDGSTRTFSKRIYSKVGVHTQAQLVSVVYKFLLESYNLH